MAAAIKLVKKGALFMLLAILLALIVYFAAGCFLSEHARITRAQHGENLNLRWGKKRCCEQGRDELVLHDGHPMENIYLVTFGGYSGNEGIDQTQIARMISRELLYFILSPDGQYMRIDNSLGQTVGYYPAENPYFRVFAQRLKCGETVNAWVYDWGWDRRYYCELKIVVYNYEETLEMVDPNILPSHFS